jgi:hypothetical protein
MQIALPAGVVTVDVRFDVLDPEFSYQSTNQYFANPVTFELGVMCVPIDALDTNAVLSQYLVFPNSAQFAYQQVVVPSRAKSFTWFSNYGGGFEVWIGAILDPVGATSNFAYSQGGFDAFPRSVNIQGGCNVLSFRNLNVTPSLMKFIGYWTLY